MAPRNDEQMDHFTPPHHAPAGPQRKKTKMERRTKTEPKTEPKIKIEVKIEPGTTAADSPPVSLTHHVRCAGA
jgi:hypothetical protein